MTYSKTRATKDNTTQYSPTTESELISDPNERSEAEIVPPSRLVPQETLVVPSAAAAKDRFASPEYVNPNARLPRIQALRGENGPSDCGYFITESEMAKAGWQHVDESELIIYEYNSGVRFV